MGCNSYSQCISLASVGSGARRLIEASGGGTVIAVFSRSFYIEDPAGRLASVGGRELGGGPLHALTAEVSFDTRLVRCHERVGLEAANASPWHPPGPPGLPLDLQAGLAAVERVMAAGIPPRGLASVDDPDPVLRRARLGLDALGCWIASALQGAILPLPHALASLVGLGPGLTPAGDDALAGALIALRTLGFAATADALAAPVLALARKRTGKISGAHLAAAAEGEGAEALHDLLAATDEEALYPALARVDRIGHSSGWDALAGVMAAWRACRGSEKRE